MSIWRWADRFAAADIPADCRITLGEGMTPLVRSRSGGTVPGGVSFKGDPPKL